MARHPDLFTYKQAEAAAEVGMTRAAERADRHHPSWSASAGRLLIDYAEEHGAPFLIEQARAYAHGRGLPAPPDGRAWGFVVRRAARRGDLVRVGTQNAKSSNNSPKYLWKVA